MKKNLLLLFMLMSFASTVFAQVPTVTMYQVQIKHGGPLPKDVMIEMQLRKSQYGMAIWNQVFNLTEVKDYSVVNLALDFGDKFDWNDGQYWLATIIDGKEMGSAQLTSVPYAFMAKRAEEALIAETAKDALTAEKSKGVEGVLTAEELIGVWSVKKESGTDTEVQELEFMSDGTFAYTWKKYHDGVLSDKSTYTHPGTWKLNGVGCLFLDRVTSSGTRKVNALNTYFDREDGSLTIGYGDATFFDQYIIVTKDK